MVEPIDEPPAKEDKDEIQLETPIKPFTRNRRSAKSRLGLISGNQGFHSVKLPSQRRRTSTSESLFNTEQATDGDNLYNAVRRKRLVSVSGKELWKFTRQHVEERKINFDKRLSQVEKIARRYTIKHSQSMRRRAKEKAVIARRSTMAASASNEANRQEFIAKRNGRLQDDCRKELFQKVVEESVVDGWSGEAKNDQDEVQDVINGSSDSRVLTENERASEPEKRQKEKESENGFGAGDISQLQTVEKPVDNDAIGNEIQEEGQTKRDEEGAESKDQQQATSCEGASSLKDTSSQSASKKGRERSVKKVSIVEYTDCLDV